MFGNSRTNPPGRRRRPLTSVMATIAACALAGLGLTVLGGTTASAAVPARRRPLRTSGHPYCVPGDLHVQPAEQSSGGAPRALAGTR